MPPPEVPERPKRLSLSQVLEMVLNQRSRARPSVTLSRVASGETTWQVDVPAGDDETAEDAERLALAIHNRLLAAFPPRSSHDAAEVTLTRNAKGETQIALAAKTTDAHPTIETLIAHVRKSYDATRAQYPMADGMTAKPGSVSRQKD